MLYFIISFVSFVLLSKSFTSKERGTKLVSTGFLRNLSNFLVSRLRTGNIPSSFSHFSLGMPLRKKSLVSKEENGEKGDKVCLLDLPDLPLECILEHLSPSELTNVAAVCTSLRDRCLSDYLWEKHMERKWGNVFSDAAYRQWKVHVASRDRLKISNQHKQKGMFDFLHGFHPFLWIKSKSGKARQSRTSLPDDSVFALYLSLESGKFWFPAQVYNREVTSFR